MYIYCNQSRSSTTLQHFSLWFLILQHFWLHLFCMFAPVLQMFSSPAALWGTPTRLQLKELFQGCHERCSSHGPTSYEWLPIYGSLPGSASCHSAPTGCLFWTHHWYHQSSFFRHQQTCYSITSGSSRWLIIGYNQESPARKSLIMAKDIVLVSPEQQPATTGGFNVAVASNLARIAELTDLYQREITDGLWTIWAEIQVSVVSLQKLDVWKRNCMHLSCKERARQ